MVLRFGELLSSFTGSEGNGPIRTYIHKASQDGLVLSKPRKVTFFLSGYQVYPWTDIEEATRVMEADQNMCVCPIN